LTLAAPLLLPEGQKIAESGVWALSMAQYHSDICDGPSVSNSGLKTIWDESPAHYWCRSYLNPARIEETEERPHFSLGRAAHHLLFLGRKGFDEEFVTRPEQWSDWRSKDAKLWREAALADGKTVITDSELELIAGMARSLAAHPLVKAGVLDGYVERSLVWKDQTGVWLKSRPDCIPNDSGDGADLKTTTSVRTDDLRRSIAAFNYPMQGALTAMAFENVLKRQLQTFSLVFVETKPPHCVRVVTIKPDDIERGLKQVRAAVNTFAECWASGRWPGPGGEQQDAEFLDVPEWARKSIDDRITLYELENAA
jgi:hypothetical protein